MSRRSPLSPLSPVWLCASQEIVLAVRSRWTAIFTVVFAVLALAVASSGYVLSGGRGVQDFARTGASLVQVVILLVPLTAVLMGVQSFALERGAAEILFAQPLPRRSFLLGKLLGLFLALSAAEGLGFGLSGLVIFARTDQEGLGGFLLVVAGSFVLTAVFLGIAALLAAGCPARRRVRALAVGLVVWFVAVLLYDIAALGAASLLRSGPASRLLIVSVIVNPVDAVRTAALFGTEGSAAFGGASLAFLRFTGGTLRAGLILSASLLVWILLPCFAAIRRIGRADIG
jgi:Cu-processing system permease protein